MNAIKPTPKMVEGLRWFERHGPISWFPCETSTPTRIIRKRLKTAGWIEECGAEPIKGLFSVTRFRISEAGRAVLAGQSQGETK